MSGRGNWRDRAERVELTSDGGWRSRAEPIEAQPTPEPVQAQPVEEPARPWRDSLADWGFRAAEATPAGAALPRGTFQSLGEFARAMRHGEGLQASARAAGETWTKERASDGPTATESLRRGTAQGATLGFRDELTGAYAGIGQGLQTAGKRLAAGDFGATRPEDIQSVIDAYVRSRDASRAEDDRSRAANPGAMLVGEIGGGAIIPAGAAASGVGLAARLGRGALAGGLSGAVQGAGSSRGDAADMRGDALLGGAFGAGVGALGPGLGAAGSAAISRMPQGLKDKASEYAMRAAGYLPSDLKRIFKGPGESAVRRQGRELLDAGVIPVGGNASDVMHRIAEARPQAGRAVGEFIEQADASGARFDPTPFLERAQREIVDANALNPALEPLTSTVQTHLAKQRKIAEDLGGTIPFRLAQDWKSGAQDVLNYGNPWNNAGPSATQASMSKDLARIVKEGIDDQVGDVLGPGARDGFQAARRRYGALADADAVSRKAAASLEGGSTFGLKDVLAGSGASSAAAAMGDPMLAAVVAPGVAALSRLSRTRGNSVLARGFDAAADLAATPAGTRFRQLAAALAEAGTLTPSAERALVAAAEAEAEESQQRPR